MLTKEIKRNLLKNPKQQAFYLLQKEVIRSWTQGSLKHTKCRISKNLKN